MAFTKYEPYPNSRFGAGDFTDDQGRTMPAYLPEEAQRLAANNTTNDLPPVPEAPQAPPANAQDFSVGVGNAIIDSEQPPMVDMSGGTKMSPTAAPMQSRKTGASLKLSDEENATVDQLVKNNPGTTREGYLKLFSHEGGTNPKATNSGHTGVFQLEDAQAKAMGVDLNKMSGAEQMALLPKYWAAHGVQPKSDADMAVANAAPGYVGQPDGTVVKEYAPGSDAYKKNPSWVDPKTGLITVGSIKHAYGLGGEPTNPDDRVARASAQLYAPMGGQPGMSQTSTTHRDQEGTPFTEEDRAALHAQATEEGKAIEAAYAPVIDAQAALQQRQIAREAEIARSRDLAQAKEDYARKLYDESTQRVQQRVNEVMQDKAPPPFTDRNLFAGIMAGIAQGMGAYSATFSHTENFASKTIDNIIDRDNERWKQQHLDKQWGVKEEKDLNQNQWHDYQTQKAEREMQQRLMVDNELQQQLAMAKTADTQKSLGLMKAANMKEYNNLEFQLQRAARGKAETTVTNATVAPTMGGAPDLETVNKRVLAGVEAGEDPEVFAAARRAHGETGHVPVTEKTRKAYVEGSGPGKPGIKDIEQSERGLLEAAQTYGFVYDPKTHEFSAPPGTPDRVARNPISGEALSPGWAGAGDIAKKIVPNKLGEKISGGADEEARKKAYLTASDAATHTIKTIYGRTNEREIDLQRQQFFGQSQDSLLNNFNRYMRDTQAKREELNATYAGAADDYARRNPKGSEVDTTPIPETPVTP